MTGNGTRKTRILWIGKRISVFPSFVSEFINKGYKVTVVENGKEAHEQLTKKFKPDVLIIDAASMRTTGTRICRSVREEQPKIPIVLISSKDNLPANEIVADVHLVLPFTIRKLVNRILLFAPGDGAEVIKVGPIHLDMHRTLVRCHGRESHITPRMAELLKMLIQKKGETLKREVLFSKIWETNYIEDTRSLDVHINWLRKIIEKDPNHPRIILTVRSVGYRLDP